MDSQLLCMTLLSESCLNVPIVAFCGCFERTYSNFRSSRNEYEFPRPDKCMLRWLEIFLFSSYSPLFFDCSSFISSRLTTCRKISKYCRGCNLWRSVAIEAARSSSLEFLGKSLLAFLLFLGKDDSSWFSYYCYCCFCCRALLLALTCSLLLAPSS